MTALRALVTNEATDDYVLFCEGVRRLTGIDLLQYKRGQMERRIRSFATRRGEESLAAYLERLRREPPAVEELLDRITINVSQLWRNPEQWEVLAEKVLPGLAEAGRIRAWSAGCSYGAEAFTLAAVCRSTVPGAALHIRGTDIDPRMIERARSGRFSADDARTAPAPELDRWFRRDGDEWVAAPELRVLMRFEVGDLLRDEPRPGAFDLVLCRNTVIYFGEPVKDALHERLATSLRPGGHLVVGSTERVSRPAEIGLEPMQPFVYRKR
jgi:chemotaxis protein methyltransferase CheR